MKKFFSLFLVLVMICAILPSAAASTIYTAKEIKVKHDFQTEGVDDGKGTATYVDVEGGYYISPWKYDVESISLTVTYNGEDYKVKTKDLKLDGLTEVKVSVYELDGKVVTSTESAPDEAKKIAKFKIDLEKWTVIAMPKTGDLEMAVKFQYKDAVPADAGNADAYPLDSAAQEQVEAPAGSVLLIQDFKVCKGTTDETKEIRTVLTPDADGVYFASRWDYKLATKEGDAGVGPNIDCKVVYNGSNKKMKGEDIQPDANNCGTMYFFDLDGKLDVAAEVPQGATVLAECTMSLDGAIWFTPKSDKITTELEFNYDASETYDAKKNVDQVKNEKPGAAAEKPAEPAAPKFTDVAADSPYAAAIEWAVGREITLGKTETTFAPADPCTVSHILTFLWRANGKPGAEEGAADRDSAAKWALEKEMIAQDADLAVTCTRSMAVTFMWKAAGSPEAKTEKAFTDVASDAEYAAAVAWAVENEITAGTGDGTTFAPGNPCNRGQIVTFLFRQLAEKETESAA